MHKRIIIFIAIVLILVALTVVLKMRNNNFTAPIAQLGDKKIHLEVVSDEVAMKTGLGGRTGMCTDCGMLFVFSKPGTYAFWMKDMKFPLDIVWINNHRVVHLEENVRADFSGIMKPEDVADAVLEVHAGTCRAASIGKGSYIPY